MKLFSVASLFCLLLALLTRRAEATLYYELRPHVTFRSGGYETMKKGVFSSYSNLKTVTGPLVYAHSPDFGCAGYNESATALPSGGFVLLLELTRNCSDYERARTAQNDLNADGVVFFHLPDSPLSSLTETRDDVPPLNYITVASIVLTENELLDILQQSPPGAPLQVQIEGHYYQAFQTSETFYFVVSACCVLLLLSCMWFVISYLKRCHHGFKNRRRRIHNENETRRVVNSLAVRTYKSLKGSEDPTCAVCLEPFHSNDTLRILPCQHEYHKRCVDPWLKLKKTCPMCKLNIVKGRTNRNAGLASHDQQLLASQDSDDNVSTTFSVSDEPDQPVLAQQVGLDMEGGGNHGDDGSVASGEAGQAPNLVTMVTIEAV